MPIFCSPVDLHGKECPWESSKHIKPSALSSAHWLEAPWAIYQRQTRRPLPWEARRSSLSFPLVACRPCPHTPSCSFLAGTLLPVENRLCLWENWVDPNSRALGSRTSTRCYAQPLRDLNVTPFTLPSSPSNAFSHHHPPFCLIDLVARTNQNRRGKSISWCLIRRHLPKASSGPFLHHAPSQHLQLSCPRPSTHSINTIC